MPSRSFVGVIPALYYVSFVTLGSLLYLICAHRKRRSIGHGRVRYAFLWLAAALLCWQLTVFLEIRMRLPLAQLWVGRFNFAVVALAVYLAFRFVAQIPAALPVHRLDYLHAVETATIVAITLLTPLVDASEVPTDGRAITVYGPLYPAYLFHILYFLAITVGKAIRERRRATSDAIAAQFSLVSFGLIVTGTVGFVTNAILPYSFADFRFCDIGSLSVLWFLLAVAYATLVKGLFDLTIVLRETLVFGILIALVLGAYSSGVFVATQYLTGSAGKAVQFVVLLIAFSFDPLRRFLERKADRLLFGDMSESSDAERNRRATSIRLLAIVMPWKHW